MAVLVALLPKKQTSSSALPNFFDGELGFLDGDGCDCVCIVVLGVVQGVGSAVIFVVAAVVAAVIDDEVVCGASSSSTHLRIGSKFARWYATTGSTEAT